MTIHTIKDHAKIFDDTGYFLIKIPCSRLKWLRHQYQATIQCNQVLEPPLQPFPKEIVWLLWRYKYRILKNDPLKYTHHSILTSFLDYLVDSLYITHL